MCRMRRPSTRVISLAVLLVTGEVIAGPVTANKAVYSFGVVPQQAATRLAGDWGPLLNHLSETSGVKLIFRTAPSIPEFERRLTEGEYDFSYMNPYHYTVFSVSPGYRAVSKVRNKRITGVFVVHKDSSISRLEELAGERLAFPSPAAFAASILTRSELRRRGIEFEPAYVNSHDSVYRGVAMGLFPAGGGIKRTLGVLEPSIRSQLRLLWTTPGYTPHAFAAHPRVPDEVVQRVAGVMHQLHTSDDGRQLLVKLGMEALEPASDRDWNDVRELNIKELKAGN